MKLTTQEIQKQCEIARHARKLFLTVNKSAMRRAWVDAAKQTSVGIQLFSITSKAFDFPITLGEIMRTNPKIRKGINRWINSKRGWSNCLIGDDLLYMLRP